MKIQFAILATVLGLSTLAIPLPNSPVLSQEETSASEEDAELERWIEKLSEDVRGILNSDENILTGEDATEAIQNTGNWEVDLVDTYPSGDTPGGRDRVFINKD
ncbi:MAG: hypothetical protein F6K14_18235 [Symploca sp. SIO2C1]|nr:hypothetical protein [Symploca sp. SIO2C1]